MPAPTGTRITLRLPDDFHHHVRDGSKTSDVLKHASQRFGRCLIMPNLKPPITTTQMAIDYRDHILKSLPPSNNNINNKHFVPLMTLYLTDLTTVDEIECAFRAKDDCNIVGCKYYPAGATTNSDAGVTDIKKCYPVLQKLSDLGMMLCIHSEVTHADIFDREPVFIEEVMKPLIKDFPQLKITMEHISTKEAVDFVNNAPDNVKASITCHHLLYNRNHMLVGGIRPHLYCLPILKAEVHRQALVEAVLTGSNKFFLGTDSAPHATTAKESACGCAGVYTAHAALELYAEVFDQADMLDKLEAFSSQYGADHYGLEYNTAKLVLEKKSWRVPKTYQFGEETVTPLRAGEEVQWSIVDITEG